MAAKTSRSKKIRFEMGFGGLFTLCLASFVLLLWMFVLGFWAGKKLLGPTPVESVQLQPSTPLVPPQVQLPPPSPEPSQELVAAPSQPPARETSKEELPTEQIGPQGGEQAKPTFTPKAKAEKEPPAPTVKLPSLTPKKTYFSLRVASLKERARAEKEAERWRKKGYEAFVKRADLGKKGIWYRVYVGKYSSIQEAKKAADKLTGLQYITPFTE